MHILLVILCTQIQLYIIGTHAKPQWAIPLYRTKRPFYKMRGELQTPDKPEDYCIKGLCPPGVTHIACNPLFWGDNCPKPREGVNMEKYKQIIMTHHNNLRNRLHSSLGNLPPAKKLFPLRWDDELSTIAMRVTNFCNSPNSSMCVNTARYLNVGKTRQTIKVDRHYTVPGMLNYIIVKIWASHFRNFDPAYVNQFPQNHSKADCKFANMVHQKAIKLGCGMLIRKLGAVHTVHFTCLYNEKVKIGERLYDIKK